MWAVGIIYFQMLVGKRPFQDVKSHRKLINLVSNKNVAEALEFPTQGVKISEEAKQFIRECLSINPRDRPDPLTVLKTHSYFAKLRKY